MKRITEISNFIQQPLKKWIVPIQLNLFDTTTIWTTSKCHVNRILGMVLLARLSNFVLTSSIVSGSETQ